MDFLPIAQLLAGGNFGGGFGAGIGAGIGIGIAIGGGGNSCKKGKLKTQLTDAIEGGSLAVFDADGNQLSAEELLEKLGKEC